MLFFYQGAETKSSASKSLRYSHGCSYGVKGNAKSNSATKQVKLNKNCINFFNHKSIFLSHNYCWAYPSLHASSQIKIMLL